MSRATRKRNQVMLLVLGMCMVVCGCATSMDSAMQGTSSTEHGTSSVEQEVISGKQEGEVFTESGTLEASKEETLLIVNEPGAEELANSILSDLQEDYNRTESLLDPNVGEVVVKPYKYFELKEDGLYCIADVEDLFYRVYTKELAEKKLSAFLDGEEPILQEIDGVLCTKAVSAPINPFTLPVKAAQKISENELLVQVDVADEESNCVELITLQQEDGVWKISRIVQEEKRSPVKVMEVNTGWSEQVKQTISLQNEMYYLGCNENGYFFAEDVSENKFSDIGTYRYGFRYWSGETEILLDAMNCYYYTYRMCEDMLVLAVSVLGEEVDTTEVKLFRLQESEGADVIWEQTKSTLPSLYDNGEELIAVIRDLDKETQATISKVVVYNLVTDEVEVIAEAEMSAYKNGERFMCAGGNDEDIYYVINRVGGDEIVRYSRANKEIVARCEMEYYVDFITGVGDMVIISETDESYLEKAGYVGILSENVFEKVCEIPLVEAENGGKIREARVVGENLYFATPSASYALEQKDGVINLYTYDCKEEDPDALSTDVLDVRADGIWFLEKENGEIIHRFIP